MRLRYYFLSTVSIIAMLCQSHFGLATTLKGKEVRVNVTRTRARTQKKLARRLLAARIPGYGLLFRHKKDAWQGANIVASVRNAQLGTWMDTVGYHTVGLLIDKLPGQEAKGSGYIRLGERIYSYIDVRGEWRDPGVRAPLESFLVNESTVYTEATYSASPAEMRALQVFYEARSYDQIKSTRGVAIKPRWNKRGACNTAQEACAGATSSAFNLTWVKAFERSLSGIRRYGHMMGNEVLRNASAQDVAHLRSFIARTGIKQQADPKAMVRQAFGEADMITALNARSRDPISDLVWRRQSWRGLGRLPIIVDLGPGKTSKAFDSERVSLGTFASGL